ncbi:MAG: ATP-binding cassette domain-containing protein [Haloarculaceae archaeon]
MQDTEGRAAIDARGVELTYSDGTEAVRGIDLTVPEGEFFGFLGPNGAGKTTIKTFATLLSPTGGETRVNGFDVEREARKVRESIGYMAQETSVDLELTARENVRFAAQAYGVPRGERAERIDELLELVDLADVADKEADEFSGGMKKRLDVATALVHDPPLVFLDEPTTGLDPKARNRLWEYFQRINDEGTTLFLTTQYLEEGLFEKVLVTPMSRTAVFLGKTAAEILRIVVQIVIILGMGVLLGAEIATGLAGAVGIVCMGILFSLWFVAFSNIVAVVTRDQESTIIGANLLQFPLLFVSTAFLPLEFLPGWIQTIATFNPVTYGVDGARALMLGEDVMTVIEVTRFGGIWDTLVPAVVVLLALDLALGAAMVYLLNRASSSSVR